MAITKDIKTAKSVQEMGNLSFDTTYNLNTVQALVYNPTTSEIDRMTQPASSLVLTDGSQKTQIVDAGGEQVTVTSGKLDVNASIDPAGLATSAKQDSLLTELQLKADLTETQPVSLASVPSHAVTNAGAFVTQVDGAALTQLQTINSLTPAVYDYIALSYTGDNLTGVVFKVGGAGGTTVSTLVLAYTGAVLDSVTKT